MPARASPPRRRWRIASQHSPKIHSPSARTARHSPVGCDDGSVRLWDVATARPIGPARMLRGRALAVAFSPDGRSLLAVDDRGDVRILAPSSGPSDRAGRSADRPCPGAGRTSSSTPAKEVGFLDPEDWRRLRSEIGDGQSGHGPGRRPRPARGPRPRRRGGRRRLRGALAPRPPDRGPAR